MLVLILIFVVGVYTLDTLADLLNLKNSAQDPTKELTKELADCFDTEKFNQSRFYLRDSTSLSIVSRSASVLLFLALLFGGGFRAVNVTAQSFFESTIMRGLAFAGILAVLNGALQLPFSAYDTFVIEERFGFNKTTVKTFILDRIKGTLIGAALGGGLLASVLVLFEYLGPSAWLPAWVAVSTFQIVLAFLAPAIILPLFYSFSPLNQGALRSAIEDYLKKQSLDISGVYTMDGSKRSTKANAFFSGFGRLRKLVLFDTLIDKHSQEEIVAVLAHEIGHFKKKHIPKSIVSAILSQGLMLFLLSRFVFSTELSRAFGLDERTIYANLILGGILLLPLGKIISLITQAFSRRFEYQADSFAAESTGSPEPLIAALKKLSSDNLSNPTPHVLKIILDYSHPPLLQRIRALKKYKTTRQD